MNPELKQRLIGAVVVTALAAIFIPMLFDDPVDNSGQLVSELNIPATPTNTGEESANKLPTSANQVLNTPDAGQETVAGTEEETELSANKELPSDEPLDDEPQVATEDVDQSSDEPANDTLDTGVVVETDKPIKTKKPIQKAEISALKQPEKVKPLTAAAVNKTEKPVVKPEKSSSELSRWTIQAGTFSKKENAISLMETLRKQGLPVTLEATKGFYRLKVGPTLDKKRALEMKAKLDSQKIQSILIGE